MRRRRGRPVSGVLLLDKPIGMSSNHALQTARRLLNAAKAGHTGTLDPLASGLLPLCFGEATKVSQFLLGADKTYRARARLGITTTTGDSEGEVLRERPVAVDAARLAAALAAHTGDLLQVPPMYSALKQGGERLYALARRGETVERPPRPVHVSRLELLEFDASEFEVELDCSKGTYVRSLIEDIGEALGCGAHMTALRRLRVGALDVRQAMDLERLRALATDEPHALDACLMPIADALAHLPQLELAPPEAASLQRGQAQTLRQPLADGWVAVFTQQRQFIGMAEARDGRLLPRRLVSQEGSAADAA
ncbi:tRNA pseudouridine(55) synthase TruB [Immundisolibacter sp.]|uniref:tRNA pseudouridine(55) synthase TruB n=1 Tax=Immundisolibacter sp. TaxID=1934948 RepID=UPI002B14CA20|nr:tRNA pseudouridine(55) synthase TruB [Immundisolibacter sp.]MEA3219007.1 tRNA pseudouridine synthase B [Immundisolibacter sp.]